MTERSEMSGSGGYIVPRKKLRQLGQAILRLSAEGIRENPGALSPGARYDRG